MVGKGHLNGGLPCGRGFLPCSILRFSATKCEKGRKRCVAEIDWHRAIPSQLVFRQYVLADDRVLWTIVFKSTYLLRWLETTREHGQCPMLHAVNLLKAKDGWRNARLQSCPVPVCKHTIFSRPFPCINEIVRQRLLGSNGILLENDALCPSVGH
jgi:hypothetical protein